jgi:uncharacterized membrane protein
MNTLGDFTLMSGFDVRVEGKNPYGTEMTLTKSTHMPRTTEEVYQTFYLKLNDNGDENEMVFVVSSGWVEKNAITEDSIKLFMEQEDSSWKQLDIIKKQSYNQGLTFGLVNVTSGTYYISGVQAMTTPHKTFGLSMQVQLIMLVCIITLLLFFAYHHNTRREERSDEKASRQEELNQYIKASLLAGHEEDAIKDRLEKAGWDKKQIDQGIRRVRFL